MARTTTDNLVTLLIVVVVIGLLLDIPRGDIFESIVRIVLAVVAGGSVLAILRKDP